MDTSGVRARERQLPSFTDACAEGYMAGFQAQCRALELNSHNLVRCNALEPWLAMRVPYVTLFGAVIVAAWFGGFGPAISAAAVAWIAAQLLFVEPRVARHVGLVRDETP